VEPTNLGIAPFAIQHPGFDCEAMIKGLDGLPSINIAFLWNTFGTSTTCLDRIFSLSKTEIIEAHITNGTCDKQGRTCGKYEFKYRITDADLSRGLARNDRAILSRFRQHLKSFRDYLTTQGSSKTCLVSPMLEANVTASAGRVLIQETRKALGDRCLVVWNPRHPSQLQQLGQDISEVHGLTVPPPADQYIANNDGEYRDSSSLASFLSANRGAIARFAWHPSFNCIKPGSPIDPRKRDCSETTLTAPTVGAILKAVYASE
jgi:hypothetical protein